MNIIDKVLSRAEFKERPPVLFDIGASGNLHPKWRPFAKYCVCVAFDADDREMGFIEKESGAYKKLYIYNRVLVAEPKQEVEFHLTRSPYCSSTLLPDKESLSQWAFAELFDVERTVSLKAVDIKKVIDELRIQTIDWFKSDSQGTDLRLFSGLGDELIKRTLVAEFEPGIIDAYREEDKLWSLLSFMDKRNFWMSDICVRGSQRIRRDLLSNLSEFERKYVWKLIPTAPGWGEVCYFNSFQGNFDKRDYLLGWVFAIVNKQYGFALQLAVDGLEKFRDPIFSELKDVTIGYFKRGYWNVPVLLAKIFAKSLLTRVGLIR